MIHRIKTLIKQLFFLLPDDVLVVLVFWQRRLKRSEIHKTYVAQWIARGTSNPKVAGSSPAIGVLRCSFNSVGRVSVLWAESRGIETRMEHIDIFFSVSKQMVELKGILDWNYLSRLSGNMIDRNICFFFLLRMISGIKKQNIREQAKNIQKSN